MEEVVPSKPGAGASSTLNQPFSGQPPTVTYVVNERGPTATNTFKQLGHCLISDGSRLHLRAPRVS